MYPTHPVTLSTGGLDIRYCILIPDEHEYTKAPGSVETPSHASQSWSIQQLILHCILIVWPSTSEVDRFKVTDWAGVMDLGIRA